MELTQNAGRSSSFVGLSGGLETVVSKIPKPSEKQQVSALIVNARRIHEDFRRQLRSLQPTSKALRLQKEYEKDKANEETDMNKLLRLKKQELTLNDEYKALKKDLKERLDDIQTKEEAFKTQAEEIITSINQEELSLIQKCHAKQWGYQERPAEEADRVGGSHQDQRGTGEGRPDRTDRPRVNSSEKSNGKNWRKSNASNSTRFSC